MVGTLDLFKLKLSPDNTMFFASKEEQTNWFNERAVKSIENISFNGSRPFRLSSNYIDATFQYNYCRYKFGDRYVYAFIENMTYNNDGTCDLNVSIDMTQTFFFELQSAIAKSNVCNTTEKDSYFSTYKAFTNKMTPNDFNSTNLGVLNKSNFDEEIWGFMLINIDPNIMGQGKFNQLYGLTDNGLQTSVMCLALPISYNKTTRTLNSNGLVNYGPKSLNRFIGGAGYLFEILENYGSYIVEGSIGITFDQLFDQLYVTEQGEVYNLVGEGVVPLKLPEISVVEFLNIKSHNEEIHWAFNLTDLLQNIPLPLRRNPYVYIRIGNDTDSIELNLLDFYSDTPVEENMQLDIYQFTSCVYPFVTLLRFEYNGRPMADRNVMFSLTSSDAVPFSVSAWQEYYSNNKATVNDGLATQQRYQSAQLRNNLGTSLVNTGINTIMGGVTWTKKLGQIGARSFKSQQAMVEMGTTATQGILGAVTQYANSKLEMEKDKALQQIGWNDIKSSPSTFSNMSSSLTSKYKNGVQAIEVDIYIAKNIEDIKEYHKQFGYVVNRMQNNPFENFKKHTNFDFISFNEVTLALEFPQFIVAMLEEQLESGIRFWYNYDNFLNYNIENSEVQNG